jgi:hypothetical protein
MFHVSHLQNPKIGGILFGLPAATAQGEQSCAQIEVRAAYLRLSNGIKQDIDGPSGQVALDTEKGQIVVLSDNKLRCTAGQHAAIVHCARKVDGAEIKEAVVLLFKNGSNHLTEEQVESIRRRTAAERRRLFPMTA